MKKFVLKRDFSAEGGSEYTLAYRELLNPAQQEAVFFDGGAALVVAGAGTGKTRTLIFRVARLIESGINPNEILLLTFTRRAAKEMLDRARDILDNRCLQARGGTFHFYCSQILHRFSDRIGYPANFTIVDTADSLEIIQFVRSGVLEEAGIKRFPNKNTLFSIISSSANRNEEVAAVVLNEYPQFRGNIEQIKQVALKYKEYKQRNFVMDFDDLLIRTKQLLEQHDDVRIRVATENRYVMIDEYQDTNRIQAELSKLFSSVHGNIMAVGDDAQSIYSFRGADHRNIMEYSELHRESKLIKLEENYRSTPQILNVANTLLKQARHKHEKNLFTKKAEGEKPALIPAPSNHDQSRFITQVVLAHREEGTSLSDMAVLFRNGRDSYDLELELKRKNIPYVKYGGQKFTEAAHIKDVLAHVRVLVNPMDTLAWNRVLMLIDGIGPKTAAEMFEWIRMSSRPYRLDLSDSVSKSYLKQLKELSTLLTEIKEDSSHVELVIEKIVEYYKTYCQKRYDDYPKRLKDLEAFVNISSNFKSLSKMLEELALDPITATAVDTEPTRKEEEPLILSTIHSAKGLEWNQVFIIQCLDGIIPSGYAVDDEYQLDEELRLLYVAVTRAREMLYFCYPVLGQSGYGEYFTQPSRFFEALSGGELEEWRLEEESSPPMLPSESEIDEISG